MIRIVDYDAGNLTSVKRALEHIGVPCLVVRAGEELLDPGGQAAGGIIFPGVGHARAAMQTLHERGLDAALTEAFRRGTPILGICLGAQIVLSYSEEGDTPCLDLISGQCRRFELDDTSLKVPHMGWNGIRVMRPHPVLDGVQEGDQFYFVHSYYPLPSQKEHVLATCCYGKAFPAVIGHGSLLATQFHPEKSGRIGLKVLQNFSRWDGTVQQLSRDEACAVRESRC